MKKILNILFILACFSSQNLVFAETNTEQSQYLTDTKATIAVQKQPDFNNNQKQDVKNNWFCIVVQINGKLKDSGAPNPDN